MMPMNNVAAPSARTSKKVEKELRKADKEYTKAEKGYQKGSIRRAEKHENRGMAHELKADGLTVGSHHGHNEATRVAMLHNSALNVAQPTIIPMAATTTTLPVSSSSSFLPQSSFGQSSYGQSSYSSGFDNNLAGRGFIDNNNFNGSSNAANTTVVLPGGPGTTTTITQQTNRF